MFVSMVAHEVKSPLAATEGWLNLILSGMLKHDTAEEHRMLQRALLRVRTLRGMVNELLSLTAIQTGNFSLKKAPVDVEAVVAEVIESSREKAAERGITLAVSPGPAGSRHGARRPGRPFHGVRQPRGERHQVQPRQGQRTVAVGQSGMYVTVSVRDDGIGISAEDCGKVFDEFYRVRGEQTASIPGTGLGLSLVKRLAELHDGTVAVSSTLGEGSEFVVSLPALPVEALPMERTVTRS